MFSMFNMHAEERMFPFFTDKMLNTKGTSQEGGGGTSSFCNWYKNSAAFLTFHVWPASHSAAPEDLLGCIFNASTWQPRCLFMLGDCIKQKLPKGQVESTSFDLSSGFFSCVMSLPHLFCLQHLPNNFCDSCFVSTWPTPSTFPILVTL